MRYMLPIFLLLTIPAVAAEPSDSGWRFEEVERFYAKEALQGVAVDEKYFYAIVNKHIGKYDKKTGEKVDSFSADKELLPLIHMNSGVYSDGLLIVSHSNFNQIPATSSIEVFKTEPLKHYFSISLGTVDGSMTAFDVGPVFRLGEEVRVPRNAFAVFAHYSENPEWTGRGTRWTRATEYDIDDIGKITTSYKEKTDSDDQYHFGVSAKAENWVFPQSVIEQFEPHSCSGASIGADGLIYATGHDLEEVYVLQKPYAGSVLEHYDTLPVTFHGQAIAWDRTEGSRDLLYAIDRPTSQVVVSRLIKNEAGGRDE
ncbi:hypothetical protein [Calycomorphotria hydatis]|uniref:SMP-30/Gluconolaconase/LRE-like region n=1 Tax=Calycomorphotria hydatis TaxID=2528027 RepID=A0A517TC81_9PLAN|nr:hypothetical protein [Calycomorphotria hydatis]QDT65972.1 hypothetical protein V22_32360 [Calycomorphotria hydatis]